MTGPAVDPLGTVYSMLIGLLRDGRSPESAEDEMRQLLPAQLVTNARERYEDQARRIIAARDPDGMHDPARLTPWYTGSRPGDVHWPALRELIRAEARLDDVAQEALDRASTKVVAYLPPPWRTDFSGRGLVLGYVQSGKTSNYTAVISKAADTGYRLFLVLSGMHTNLRRQTQFRLDEHLHDLNPQRWIQLTTAAGDFGDPGNVDNFLSQNQSAVLAVVKKNPRRLRNLLDWLSGASKTTLMHCPVLIIDDEADQASVNTAKARERRKTINRLILELLTLQKVAYVGYTATPFANIFVDPTIEQDLYPRDFIVDLPRPATYFGPERVFGRDPVTELEAETGVDGLDMIRTVEPAEVALLRPPRRRDQQANWSPVANDSLRAAVRWFVLATAARRARGQHDRHSSMLIHTTQNTTLHFHYVDLIKRLIAELTQPVVPELRDQWDRETARVTAAELDERPVTFDEVAAGLHDVLSEIRVVVDNFRSQDRLDYGHGPQTVIVIGGNTLSRGLTLEGLVVSYFLRTAAAYDTLLQMARWFGYRSGYADLPRIWTTPELVEYFEFLATVEAEMRHDVARYEREDLTPREFAVRIRTHPKLAITSALKMQHARDTWISYSGRRLQTILFDHKNRHWLARNMAAGQRLLAAARSQDPTPHAGGGRRFWREVPVEAIREFLNDRDGYQFHPDSQDLVADRILAYVDQQNSHGELLEWNVGLVTPAHGNRPTLDLGSADQPLTVRLINRAAVKVSSISHANIKTLMSRPDRVLDLDLPSAEIAALTDSELQDMRPPRTGLIILYPIDKDSQPLREGTSASVMAPPGRMRIDLTAVEHVLGVGLVFPDALEPGSQVSYSSVALPLGDVEEPDEETDEDSVDPDSFDGEDSVDHIDQVAP